MKIKSRIAVTWAVMFAMSFNALVEKTGILVAIRDSFIITATPFLFYWIVGVIFAKHP